MVDKLEFTGERFTPECEREIWYEHIHRYAFAARLCDGARVLDAACGEGYGSSMLAVGAEAVTGVDIDAVTVKHAIHQYGNQDKLAFQQADCTDLPFEDDRFDVVVSFETLEHLSNQQQLIAEFRRVLKPRGFLILSSPDKAEYSDKLGFENEFHEKELYREELEHLIAREFPAYRLLGQKLMFHSVIWEPGDTSEVELMTATADGRVSAGSVGHAPMYYLAICAASDEYLPNSSAGLSLLDDNEESVYAHYQHEIKKNMSAGRILAERDAELNALKAEGRRGKSFWDRLTGKN